MSSHKTLGGGDRSTDSDRGTTPSSERAPRLICTACQRPIEDETPSEWQGEPVHFECGAALRSGNPVGQDFSE